MCSSKITPRIDPVLVSTIRELYRGPALAGVTRQLRRRDTVTGMSSCRTSLLIGHERLRLCLSPCRARILDYAALTNSSLILGMGIGLRHDQWNRRLCGTIPSTRFSSCVVWECSGWMMSIVCLGFNSREWLEGADVVFGLISTCVQSNLQSSLSFHWFHFLRVSCLFAASAADTITIIASTAVVYRWSLHYRSLRQHHMYSRSICPSTN